MMMWLPLLGKLGWFRVHGDPLLYGGGGQEDECCLQPDCAY